MFETFSVGVRPFVAGRANEDGLCGPAPEGELHNVLHDGVLLLESLDRGVHL